MMAYSYILSMLHVVFTLIHLGVDIKASEELKKKVMFLTFKYAFSFTGP